MGKKILSITRVVVTRCTDEPETLYDWYRDRGPMEGSMKDCKLVLKSKQLSDHRF